MGSFYLLSTKALTGLSDKTFNVIIIIGYSLRFRAKLIFQVSFFINPSYNVSSTNKRHNALVIQVQNKYLFTVL
jgi:hypothetical protein